MAVESRFIVREPIVREPIVRKATSGDVAGLCEFGEEQIRSHYAPLIGPDIADAQVRGWWNADEIGAGVGAGLVVVAEDEGLIVGVGQRGRNGADHVIYKLHVHPHYRGRGLGPRLIEALADGLPPEVDRLYIEHFEANVRAGLFYEREGFTVARIAASPAGDPTLSVVWRVRGLGPRGADRAR